MPGPFGARTFRGARLTNHPLHAVDRQLFQGVSAQSPPILGRSSALGGPIASWQASRYSGAGVLLDNTGNGHSFTNNGATFLPFTGEKYAYTPGHGLSNFTTPTDVTMNVVNNFSVEWEGAYDDYSPGTEVYPVGRYRNTGNNRSWLMRLVGNTFGTYLSSDGISTIVLMSNASAGAWPVADGARIRLRMDIVLNNGSGQRTGDFFYSLNFGQTSGHTWIRLGTQVVSAGAITLFAPDSPLTLFSAHDLTPTTAAKHYAVKVTVDGVVVVDWRASEMIFQSGPFLDNTGRTFTFNRVASGKKMVLVDRPLFLFGVDDYMETPDHANLDFAAGDPFTLILAMRAFGTWVGTTAGRYISKKAVGAIDIGYEIFSSSATQLTGGIGDGGIGVANVGTVPLNAAVAVGLRRDVVADNLQLSNKGVALAAASNDLTTGSLDSASVLRLGCPASALSTFGEFELFGAAIFRRALTDAEMLQVGAVLSGGLP